MLVVLNGDAPEVAPTATEEPAPTEAPAPAEAPVATAGYNAPQTRLGKKIAASTQAQISEGLSMIQDGYKAINKAIAIETARSINIKPLTKLSTEEIMNLI